MYVSYKTGGQTDSIWNSVQCSCVAFLVSWMRLHVGHYHAEHEVPISTNARLIISHLVAVKSSARLQLGSKWGRDAVSSSGRGTSEAPAKPVLVCEQWGRRSAASQRVGTHANSKLVELWQMEHVNSALRLLSARPLVQKQGFCELT